MKKLRKPGKLYLLRLVKKVIEFEVFAGWKPCKHLKFESIKCQAEQLQVNKMWAIVGGYAMAIILVLRPSNGKG